MKVIRFDFSSDRTVHVVAASVQDGLKHLCENDYFFDEDDGASVEWNDVPEDRSLTVGFDDDPDADDLAMPGSTWDAVKRTITAPASSWASIYDAPAIIGDSES